MKAVVVEIGKGAVELRKVERPEPGPREVAVRPLRVGLDGTDVEIVAGEHGEPPPGRAALIVGHEVVGEVELVGEGVEGLVEGDLVTATVRRPDPLPCFNCRSGEPDFCLREDYAERGIKGRDGYLAGRFVERPEYLVRVPEGLREYGFLTEPMSVVEKGLAEIFAVQRRMTWEPSRAVVLGAGQIGLFATALLRLRGVEAFTLDRSGEDTPQAKLMRVLGATHVNTREEPFLELAERAGPIDIVVEATGYAPLALEAMRAIGPNGVVCLISVTGGQRTVEIDAVRVNRNLVLGNGLVFGTVSSGARDFEAAIGDLGAIQERWPGFLDSLVDRRLTLEEAPAALEEKLPGLKTVVDLARSP